MGRRTDAMDDARRFFVEKLFSERESQLRAYLTQRLPTASDVEDALQDAFVRLCRIDDIAHIENPSAFLFRIAENIVRDFYRHAARQSKPTDVGDLIEQVPSQEPSAERIIFGGEWLKAYGTALNELPPKCRAVFIMCRVENRPHHEIAMQLGISTKMVEKYMTRALSHLRLRLDVFLAGDD